MIAETSSLCLSDIRIDRWISGELASSEEHELRTHADGCARCTARVAELTAYRDRFLAARPALNLPAPLAERKGAAEGESQRKGHLTVLPGGLGPETRVDTPPPEHGARPSVPAHAAAREARGRRAWAAGGASLLVAAAAVLVLVRSQSPSLVDPVPGPNTPRSSAGSDNGADSLDSRDSRSKGSFTLTAFIARNGAVIEALPGAAVRPEEPVQLVYDTTKPGYLAVLGRDGSGASSVYVANGDSAIAMVPGENIHVPNSIVFDDTPGAETLYAIACPTAFAIAPLRQALDREGTLSKLRLTVAIQGCQVIEFPLVKDLGNTR